MTLPRVWPLCVSLVALLTPARGAAFSDPEMFARPTLAAGGGGRYFTGSPADGYSCSVCHSGGLEPALKVTGLPDGGYQPRARYEVMLTWDAQIEKFSTALEFTDERGRAAGVVRLPPADETQAPEFCEPATDGIFAASLADLPDGRQVMFVPDCGAKRARLLWTAPVSDVGNVWLSGSAVWSDGKADPVHDGVTDYGRVLSSSGVAATWNAGCAVNAPASATLPRHLLIFGLLVWAWVRFRNRRARTSSPSVAQPEA